MKKIIISALVLLSIAFMAPAQQGAYQLSSHILDISEGRPAAGVTVHLYRYDETRHEWEYVYNTKSDDGGRIENILPMSADNTGTYKLRFDTSAYFTARGQESIYPFIEVVFQVKGKAVYHLPILISANGYSTYRGS